MPFQAFPVENRSSLAKHMVQDSQFKGMVLVTGMGTEAGNQENKYNSDAQDRKEHVSNGGTQNANSSDKWNDHGGNNAEQQPKHEDNHHRCKTYQASGESTNESGAKENQSIEKVSSRSDQNKDVSVSHLQLPQRSDSICSSSSENSDCYSTPNSSISLSLDSSNEVPGHSKRTRRKACRECDFYKLQLQRLEEKVSELMNICKVKEEALQNQQFHYDEQIRGFTNEIQTKDYYLKVAHHRHEIMASKVTELQKKILTLTQTFSPDRVAGLEFRNKLQEEEISTLKFERDREKKEKEMILLQKESERLEKENERKRYESERDRRRELEKEVYKLRIELKRTKSFHCEENVFLFGEQDSSDVDNLEDFMLNCTLSGSNLVHGNGAHTSANASSSNQMLSKQHNLSLQAQSIPPGYNQTLPPGHNQTLPPGHNQALPPGYNQTLPPGHNQTLPPGYNQTLPPGHNQALPPGHNQALPPGHNQALPPGYNQTLPPGHNQALPPGHNQALPPGHNQALPPGHNQALPPGHNQALPPGHNQALPPGHNGALPPGHNQTLPYSDTNRLFLRTQNQVFLQRT